MFTFDMSSFQRSAFSLVAALLFSATCLAAAGGIEAITVLAPIV